MMDFAGFDDWVEIFEGGTQTDSRGRQVNGDILIDQAVNTFDATHHEPPLVVGHPTDDSPAFGWVEALKSGQRGGRRILLARFRQVQPEFEELVKKGVYKKRSASFYGDGRLRHVGFLGGMPPAVKGLADIKFGAEPATEFIQQFHEEKSMDIKEFFEALKFWKEAGGEIKPTETPPAAGATFTEQDIEAARQEAAAAERERLTREFAEKEAQAKREGSPAHAGIDLAILPPCHHDPRLPRARGDRPVSFHRYPHPGEAPPRTRGSTP